MASFKKVSADAFDNFQLGAGLILKSFNPSSVATPSDSDIVCATTGGVQVSAVAEFVDYGEDVDNCPNNTKEMKRIRSWDCKMSFNALEVTADTIKLALGAADVSATKITPRADVKAEDFADIWWVGERAGGGLVAVCLKNALSSGGFSLQTSKEDKGTIAVELTGHISIGNIDVIPMECYVLEA